MAAPGQRIVARTGRLFALTLLRPLDRTHPRDFLRVTPTGHEIILLDHSRGGYLAVPPNGLKELAAMLVLTRKLNETIIIDGHISITVVGIRGNHVRLGINAPEATAIYRSELCERVALSKSLSGPEEAEMSHAANR